jgi:VanZ family protein
MTPGPPPGRPQAGRARAALPWLAWGLALALWTACLTTSLPALLLASAVPQPGARFTVAKAGHVTGYAGLTVLAAWLPARAAWRWALVAGLILHGGVTELIQTVVPGRTGTWQDAGLDLLGVALGLAFSYWRWRRRPAPPGPG